MFEKNLEFLTREEAAKIRGTKAAVIGLGALGQMAAHLLVRSGFEHLVLADGDRMSASNFNRQLYADILTLYRPKTEVVCERLGDISPRLKLETYPVYLDRTNGPDIVGDADLILDCVDQIKTKLYLEELAEEKGIPLIHGAVNGWTGQAAVIFPGERVLSAVYANSAEQKESALMITVNVIASVQAAEAVKYACGRTSRLRGRLLCVDLLNGEADDFAVKTDELSLLKR